MFLEFCFEYWYCNSMPIVFHIHCYKLGNVLLVFLLILLFYVENVITHLPYKFVCVLLRGAPECRADTASEFHPIALSNCE
jgi:hypothetical protein